MIRRHLLALLLAGLWTGCQSAGPVNEPFTIAVIPDTQNYIDYRHQRDAGFALDASELFIQQMQDVSERDDVVFIAAVGDVWQHQSIAMDPAHAARGMSAIPNPFFATELAATPRTRDYELPRAIQGYRIVHDAGIPFGVAPGNHDYDAMWSVAGYPPNLDKPRSELTLTPADIGLLHLGGLDNFRSVFGASTEFFRDKPWYVDSFRGGADSAQVFSAGGYRFLHITLEMSADDAALAWAAAVIERHPGYPTIVTTHDYLDTRGERRSNPIIDLKVADPEHHNSAEQVWDKLVSAYDQVFLVLSGHHHGQALRIDNNRYGHKVYQVLADYQGRGQVGIEAGVPPDPRRSRPRGLGDGWYRLMRFELGGAAPMVTVQTWSSYYRRFSGEQPNYASWYRDYEQPKMSDAEFLAADEFTLELTDFRARFGPGAKSR